MKEVILHYNPKDDRYYLYYGEDYIADSMSATWILRIFNAAIKESKGEALLSEMGEYIRDKVPGLRGHH